MSNFTLYYLNGWNFPQWIFIEEPLRFADKIYIYGIISSTRRDVTLIKEKMTAIAWDLTECL